MRHAPAGHEALGHDLYRRVDGYDELAPLLASDEETLVRLGKPTLVRIPGTECVPGAGRFPATEHGARARLVSCLLHGNEDSGYRAVLRLLRRGERFPFDLWVFIGNVRAAHEHGWFAHRFLDGQEDFNRVWGVTDRTTRMRQCAAAVLDELRAAPLEAALDIHNNTGANPPYVIVPRPDAATEALAARVSDMVVHWNRRVYALMEALVDWCPAVSVECGLPGIEEHHRYAEGALARFLEADPGSDPPAPRSVYELTATVHVRREVAFSFGGPLTEDLDLVLVPGLDGHNFGTLAAGTVLGHVPPGGAMPLVAFDMWRHDVTDRYFAVRDDGVVVVAEDLTPAMMVTTVQQERRDCLFYVARRRR